jgi:hypothetical protein
MIEKRLRLQNHEYIESSHTLGFFYLGIYHFIEGSITVCPILLFFFNCSYSTLTLMACYIFNFTSRDNMTCVANRIGITELYLKLRNWILLITDDLIHQSVFSVDLCFFWLE